MPETRFTFCPVVARCRRALVAAILLALIGCAQAAPWSIDGAERVVAIGDVHGAYDGMLRTLQSAGVIDDEQSWVAGNTHLVITGDVVDRGADSRKVMDLIMKLEQQAPQSGGAVHLLLGNHEVMNLVGDLRYVARGEYAAFADEEDAGERARWLEHFRAANAGATDDETLRADFENKAPPGFFAHRRAFRPDGQYGRWLLEKPLLLVIDGTAFVHGGLSPLIAELGLDGVNTRLRSELQSYLQALTVLDDAGILSPIENFNYHAELLKPLQSNTEMTAEVQAAIATVIALNESEIHGIEGPLWYRGNVACGPLTENDKLDRALAAIGARRVVIGHTPTVTRRVLQRLDGRVIEIDTGMLTSAYKGSGNALVIAGDSLVVVNESGATSDGPVPHPQSFAIGSQTRTAD
ncbi:MAG: metallophosphoesterase, partial [Woeseiaceae bacterium]|nr:metallophosphoesterase [Woeseiaceae bacterium]